MSSPVPVLGRNARFIRDTNEIAYGKGISVAADAEIIKVYSMDSLQPAITGAGKQSFKWSCDRLFTDKSNLADLIAGTKFDMLFAPEGDPDGETVETWKNCTILHCERKAGEDDGARAKDGKSESTIIGRTKILSVLAKRGANLFDPESIKESIAKQPWSNGRKNNACDAYSSFLRMVGGTWTAPIYQTVRKLPFIPKETEIDQLIAGCSKRMATFLQMLKETGARCGEIWQLKWDDVDFESKVVNITPEKNSNPRVTRLSEKLLGMLRQLPKNYGENVFAFPTMRIDNHAVTFQQQRRRIANKIGNPRIIKIHFHTLRHFKGTMLYHKTKDLLYVMQALGHKNIKNTLLYIQLEEALFQGEIDYISKIAKTPGEICALIEAGFEYVTEMDGLKFFKKRKT